jgi:hypothetical protein
VAKTPFVNLRKRRTREHVIADLSVNHVERHVLLCGFSVERIRLDYGIDLMVQTYNRVGEVENGRIFCQLKATNRIRISRDGRSVLCRVDKADLRYWLGELMPVILVQYDVKRNVAYWVHVQAHLTTWRDLGRASTRTTLALPRANILDQKAVRAMARKKNEIVNLMREGSHHAD